MNKFMIALCSLVLAGSMSQAAGHGGGGAHSGGGGGHASSGGGHSSGGGGGHVGGGGGGTRPAPVHSAPVRSAPVQHAPTQANHPVQGGNHSGPVNHGPVNHGGTVNHGGQHNGFANGTHGRYTGSTHVTINNRTYVSRTYVNSRGGTYHGYYAPRSWGGRPYYAFYGHWGYGPGFWGVYWNPFAPFYYTWAWATAPWYVDYWGWYYHPYVTYTYPYQVATDYAYQDSLNSAYEAGVAAGRSYSSSAQGGTPLSSGDHDVLAQQTSDMNRNLKAGTEIDVKDTFSKPNYLFVVGSDMSFVPDGASTACSLSGGDVFKVVTPPAPTEDTVKLMVVAVKPGGCLAGTVFPMSISDLQETLNSWAERVEKGNHDFEAKKLNGSAPKVAQP